MPEENNGYDFDRSEETANKVNPCDETEQGELREWLENYSWDQLIAMKRFCSEEECLTIPAVDEVQATVELQEVLREVLIMIVDAKRPELEADCLALAVNLPLRGGASLAEVGKYHNVSKQYLSRKVLGYQRLLGLKKVPGQKSDKACEQYRTGNHRNGKI